MPKKENINNSAKERKKLTHIRKETKKELDFFLI
jgi:hypothetical protein